MIARARSPRPTWALLVLTVTSIAVATGSLFVGSGDLGDVHVRDTLLSLRMSRLAAAALAGAALAVGGVLVQGLFRNPLASPSIIGTTAGAAFGGRAALLLGELLGAESPIVAEMVLPAGCTLGALGALAFLLFVTRLKDDLVVILLTGFLLSSLFVSLGGLVMSLAAEQWELVRAMVGFTLGDVSSAGPGQVALAIPLVLFGIGAAFLWAWPLDVLLTGESEAATLGLDVTATRTWCVVWTAILTAAAVAIGGNVGFVGLIVPHALRPFVGVRHAALVPAAALGGAAFLVACDALARLAPGNTELPLGVVTGLIGAPLFLWLLFRSRREVSRA